MGKLTFLNVNNSSVRYFQGRYLRACRPIPNWWAITSVSECNHSETTTIKTNAARIITMVVKETVKCRVILQVVYYQIYNLAQVTERLMHEQNRRVQSSFSLIHFLFSQFSIIEI